MKKLYIPVSDDKRLYFAKEYFKKSGYYVVNDFEECDFTLLGINPKDYRLYTSKPVFAGNVSDDSVFDYSKEESFALENAYLTAEAAISKAVSNSEVSLIDANILIIGYGRIAKALLNFLLPYSKNITICARSDIQRLQASLAGAKEITFDDLKYKNDYTFVFNTVAHPVVNKLELLALPNDTIILDLASFPGGVDKMYAKAFNKKLIVARGLPGEYSPKSAGIIIAKAVHKMIERGEIKI